MKKPSINDKTDRIREYILYALPWLQAPADSTSVEHTGDNDADFVIFTATYGDREIDIAYTPYRTIKWLRDSQDWVDVDDHDIQCLMFDTLYGDVESEYNRVEARYKQRCHDLEDYEFEDGIRLKDKAHDKKCVALANELERLHGLIILRKAACL